MKDFFSKLSTLYDGKYEYSEFTYFNGIGYFPEREYKLIFENLGWETIIKYNYKMGENTAPRSTNSFGDKHLCVISASKPSLKFISFRVEATSLWGRMFNSKILYKIRSRDLGVKKYLLNNDELIKFYDFGKKNPNYSPSIQLLNDDENLSFINIFFDSIHPPLNEIKLGIKFLNSLQEFLEKQH